MRNRSNAGGRVPRRRPIRVRVMVMRLVQVDRGGDVGVVVRRVACWLGAIGRTEVRRDRSGRYEQHDHARQQAFRHYSHTSMRLHSTASTAS